MKAKIPKMPSVRSAAAQPRNEAPRPMGMDRGKVLVADDFDAPLPDDLLKAFYGGKLPKIEQPKKKRRS